ncbi:MAG TPA: YifB family Mg chelatase-like AAA ATPase, partial [Candidatus Paceibacterota bacterium]|nr:YifB family Mg chelatase-like AAA ATPase [Candidatus Paceibacterota bacterium]
FAVVGLPDKAVEESSDRVSAAIKNSGFESPKSRNEKTVISLAPADIKKEGPMFDVPIALAYLCAAGDVRFDPANKLFIGELSLDGSVRGVPGVLPLVLAARAKGFTDVFVPESNSREAALVAGISVFPVRTLSELLAHLDQRRDPESRSPLPPQAPTKAPAARPLPAVDFEDIRGQEAAKRGMEVAAAGGHNIALWGPPGTGKTLLAKAVVGIMPPLSFEHALEVTGIHSVAGTLREDIIIHPPFRAPHHTSSYVSLVGGGSVPKPGEITLAHRGVLFLDEFPEFDRRVIEALRQPLEERVVSVSRVKGSARFPADVILVAALNPCPCGNWGSAKLCTCTPQALVRYQKKLSGPIVDSIDMWLSVLPVEHEKLAEAPAGERSDAIRARVERAREIQTKRFEGTMLVKNSDMGVKDIDRFAELADDAKNVLMVSAAKLELSARAYHRVIKLARTIADLAESDAIGTDHVLEALQYRTKAFMAV